MNLSSEDNKAVLLFYLSVYPTLPKEILLEFINQIFLFSKPGNLLVGLFIPLDYYSYALFIIFNHLPHLIKDNTVLAFNR